jgi:2-polyprenyl-3-methyl-5-hydroxy-6-metoxy-1,4-benzoquinol methylase
VSKYSQNMPHDLKAAIGWMYDYIEPGTDFLDFGCATGYFGSLIKKSKGCKVYGVEISEDVKQARKVLDGVYSFDLDGDWPKEVYERSYDYLFFGDVIEHLKDPESALKKAYDLLKPGGKVLISTPNIAHISTRLELLQGNFEYEPMGILDNTHLKYFTLRSLTEIAQNAGYTIEKVDSSVNDYPQEVVEKILARTGLKATKKFWDMLQTLESRAYQYKLILAPTAVGASSRKNAKPLPIAPLPDKPEKFRDAYIEDLHKQVRVLHEHSNKQGEIIDHLTQLNTQLAADNENLRAKPFNKLQRAAKKIVHNRRKTNGVG